ncbi:MAG: 50S ribosomal protein L24 [candidate division WWE3 bacterium GW2011_GWF2_41_45]|uniref:Large ribosomal subunit protein uL24 n=3 Tax=Katanobacteria TaxID=422282 RepID=A0A1F4W3I3_UNCKA|nr:MAG: 50S ribosomal protein L24 [candidate division WWE3 bacterium GW2011_GWC2_41_23]KKS10762.1 MAG: 50S ribosomal protein L24 [candidate division WWE3 bacterium GW2011_GWF2_41_45]KKS12438.1 MAG: 50S ribosomal protein L24 [candidate division WWE3 bacterium GW2011_GWF1_41_53]KKS20183.1 MAG: 50S ribosomal protein L24 [candidate division WWE3 bacterium GW2011_GWE1_41_72]KKS28379.1 MAG: 50S ribosomal protein L24 [candidate division WWE3 bacterium GW2011_GWC1_42_102]KKS29600.1 MAG: 50S ribosomal 
MKILKDDKVKVIAGKDKGKTGKVLKVLLAKGKVLVEGVNIIKKHVKPGKVSKEGGIISMEKPVNVSNVMLIDQKSGDPVRVGYKIIDGKKYRINKKSGEVIEVKKGK